MGLMEAYKKEPGGVEKLKERNPKWINDDYVKFIRMSESMIDKNGEGVLGFITNHGYLDNGKKLAIGRAFNFYRASEPRCDTGPYDRVEFQGQGICL